MNSVLQSSMVAWMLLCFVFVTRSIDTAAFSPLAPHGHPMSSSSSSSSSTARRYREDPDPNEGPIVSRAPTPRTTTASATVSSFSSTETGTATAETRTLSVRMPKVKPIIETIESLDGLQYFLEEDDRLSVVKFYAPWCKTCKKLEMEYNHKFAMTFGDTIDIVKRQKVQGRVRVAQVEFHPTKTKHLIQDQLQIVSIPTLQVYHGTRKVWELSGSKSTKELSSKLQDTLLPMRESSGGDWERHVQRVDDGILQNAIDDSFFDDDYPDFLNEEW